METSPFSMAAVACVFDTVELFEAVLVCLPARDLLLAQRVSRRWQNVIAKSTKLQRALFFVPNQGDPLTLAFDGKQIVVLYKSTQYGLTSPILQIQMRRNIGLAETMSLPT